MQHVSPPTEPGRRARLGRVVREEFGGAPLSVRVSGVVARLVPDRSGYRVRTALLRAFGWKLPRSAVFASVPSFSGTGDLKARLSVGDEVWVNSGCHFELHDRIVLGDGVAIGHDVLIMTATHHVGTRVRRAGALTVSPVVVGAGAWIGARSVILPGVTIGPGAIVSAGSVVNADVPANSVVAGTPAQVVVPRLPG